MEYDNAFRKVITKKGYAHLFSLGGQERELTAFTDQK